MHINIHFDTPSCFYIFLDYDGLCSIFLTVIWPKRLVAVEFVV